MTRNLTGFTLIEVMVVVVILGILAAVVVPRVMSRPDEARAIRAQQDLRAISAALDLYRLDHFSYPTTDEGLEALVGRSTRATSGSRRHGGAYLDALPRDPWGRHYRYLSPGEHGPFDLDSYGRDDAPGGEDADADVGNWTL